MLDQQNLLPFPFALPVLVSQNSEKGSICLPKKLPMHEILSCNESSMNRIPCFCSFLFHMDLSFLLLFFSIYKYVLANELPSIRFHYLKSSLIVIFIMFVKHVKRETKKKEKTQKKG